MKPVIATLFIKIMSTMCVLWILGLIYYTYTRYEELTKLKLNEMGDFFAGAFAAPAFLLLALSLMYQRIELARNTEAINDQTDEHKANVRVTSLAAIMTHKSNESKTLFELGSSYVTGASNAKKEANRYLGLLKKELDLAEDETN